MLILLSQNNGSTGGLYDYPAQNWGLSKLYRLPTFDKLQFWAGLTWTPVSCSLVSFQLRFFKPVIFQKLAYAYDFEAELKI